MKMPKKLQFPQKKCPHGHFFGHFGLKTKNVICSKNGKIFFRFFILNGQLDFPDHPHILFIALFDRFPQQKSTFIRKKG